MNAAGAVLADGVGWGHMDGWGGGWMWFGGVAMMLIFVTVLVWAVRAAAGPSGPGAVGPDDPNRRAREVLAERYARGELSTEEYRERIGELR